jgi:hypothetical protein
MGKDLEILQAAVNFISNWFDGALRGIACYSGNDVQLVFSGYSLYPSGKKGDVIFCLPSDYVTVSSTGVKYRELSQAEVRFCQGDAKTAFAHPHIWNSGQPCWDHHNRKAITDLFVYMLNTMLYTNANMHSLNVGHPCPDSVMYRHDYSQIVDIVEAQKRRLVTNMHLPRDILDTKHFNIKFAQDIEIAQRIIFERASY